LIPLHESGDIDLTSSAFERINLLGTRAPGPHRERQQQDHPHGAHVDPKHSILVIPDLGTDDLRILGIEKDTGKLQELEPIKLKPGSGPRHVLFSHHDEGEKLYVLNELDNSISVFKVEYPSSIVSTLSSNSRYPSLTLLQSNVSLLPLEPMPHQSSFDSWHAAELHLSPSGQTLYATNRSEGHNPLHPPRSDCSDLLAVFPLDQEGKLIVEERELIEIGGRCPRHFSLSPTTTRDEDDQDGGKWMVVCCHDSDELIMFERIGIDGRELKEVARLESCGKPAVAVWLS